MKKWGIAASLLLLVTLSVFLHAQQAQQATVQEEERVFKTYPFSGPDPAPIMTRSSMWGKGPRPGRWCGWKIRMSSCSCFRPKAAS
jgi:hypothetical protein